MVRAIKNRDSKLDRSSRSGTRGENGILGQRVKRLIEFFPSDTVHSSIPCVELMAVIEASDKSKKPGLEYQSSQWPPVNVARHWKECKCVMNIGPVPHGVTGRLRLTDCPINGAPDSKTPDSSLGRRTWYQTVENFVGKDRSGTPD